MKQWLCILLSLYCVVLSAMPCNDDCDTHAQESRIMLQQAENHLHNEHGECSPFCYCTCCASMAVVTHIANFGFTQIVSITSRFTLLHDCLLEQSFSIWQPPKLG